MNTILNAVIIVCMFAVACLVLRHRYRLARKWLDVARYRATGDASKWGTTYLLGRKEARTCPDCGTWAGGHRTIHQHNEHHYYIYALEDRIVKLEKAVAEALGGGPAEVVAEVPWDGLTGELTEHAGAVDVTAGELEARADDPEPEEFKTFREKYGSLIRP